MTHADINDLETRDYIFKIGDRGKGIQARYDENTDALIFPRAAFDYVYDLLKEALSQEPCDDAISRQAALDCFTATKLKKFDFILYAREEIKKLPPVVPQQNSGKWEDLHRCWVCSECGQETHIEHNYCPNCGAYMVESQESEE